MQNKHEFGKLVVSLGSNLVHEDVEYRQDNKIVSDIMELFFRIFNSFTPWTIQVMYYFSPFFFLSSC